MVIQWARREWRGKFVGVVDLVDIVVFYFLLSRPPHCHLYRLSEQRTSERSTF